MRPTPVLSLTFSAAALAACVTVAAPASAVAAEASYERAALRCQGKPVTHVIDQRSPDAHLTTAGPDVVVVRIGGYVDVRDGDDLVCVRAHRVVVRGGDGDDRIIVEVRSGAEASLGKGDDHFRGNRGDDTVLGDAAHSGHDVIRTRGGDDHVVTGSAHDRDRDRIDLGSGDDFVFVSDDDVRRASFRGGSGSDELSLTTDFQGNELVVDNVRAIARSDGSVALRWDGFEQFDLTLTSYDARRFVGGPADEEVSFGREGVPEASMGAGDDVIRVGGVAPSHPLDGGPGTDVVDAFLYGSDITGSLLTDTLEWLDDGTRVVIAFRDVEGLEVWPTASNLIGDEGDNILTTACGGAARGGAGHDTLSNDPLDEAEDCARSGVQLFGEAGNDFMAGGPGADVLDGGEGTDSADGKAGADTCVAETRLRCEA